jgi:hypothetical protein
MLADAHRQAAGDIEATIARVQADPRAARVVIESCWGAAFHWIAFGTQQKHGQHQESHTRLGRALRGYGESVTADRWQALDRVRQGGWYGGQTDTAAVQQVVDLLGEIRAWATT